MQLDKVWLQKEEVFSHKMWSIAEENANVNVIIFLWTKISMHKITYSDQTPKAALYFWHMYRECP